MREDLEEYRRLRRVRIEHLVGVREPLVLISQIQRSGGTLLSQLFDGHPECHAHPGELHFGHPHKLLWPSLGLEDTPERWFESLYERKVGSYLRKGYSKASRRLQRGADYDVLPFLFRPGLQRELFLHCAGAGAPERERDVFDWYMTSFFNAWLDNHNLYTGPKRVVTGFAAGLAARAGDVDGFFSVYPDGTLISIVRDPKGWFESARRYKDSYADVDASLALWRESTEAAIEAKRRRPERVLLLSYEQLVREPDRVMRGVAERLGITFSDSLLVPTFNGLPIRADSSEPVESYGILAERADAHRETLGARARRAHRARGRRGCTHGRSSCSSSASAHAGETRRFPPWAPFPRSAGRLRLRSRASVPALSARSEVGDVRVAPAEQRDQAVERAGAREQARVELRHERRRGGERCGAPSRTCSSWPSTSSHTRPMSAGSRPRSSRRVAATSTVSPRAGSSGPAIRRALPLLPGPRSSVAVRPVRECGRGDRDP